MTARFEALKSAPASFKGLHKLHGAASGSPRYQAVLSGSLLGNGTACRTQDSRVKITGKRRNRLFVYDQYLSIRNEGTEAP